MKLMQKYQSTLKNTVIFQGYGIHSGRLSTVKICPADVGCGIIFKRYGEGGTERIFQAKASEIGEVELSTVLGCGDARIETIEHLMAAIAAYNLDNLIIEVLGNEIPILDGSSWQYCQGFEEVGVVQQDALRFYYIIKKPLRVEVGSSIAEFLPFNGCHFDVTISFSSSSIGKQQLNFDLTAQGFRDNLARARTFGFIKDVEKLRAVGKGQGASLENALIIGLNDEVINPGGPYWKDEYVRHKMLDAVGDTALLGAPFIGLFRSYCSGHRVNIQLVRDLLENQSCYEKIHL